MVLLGFVIAYELAQGMKTSLIRTIGTIVESVEINLASSAANNGFNSDDRNNNDDRHNRYRLTTHSSQRQFKRKNLGSDLEPEVSLDELEVEGFLEFFFDHFSGSFGTETSPKTVRTSATRNTTNRVLAKGHVANISVP